MKILLDTSVLFPGFKYPDLEKKLIKKVIDAGMTPVVTDYILDELRVNIEEQYTTEQKAVALDLWLQTIGTGVLEVKVWDDYVEYLDEALTFVPEKDAPVLAATMLEDIDLLVTKDEKHFLKNKQLQGSRWYSKVRSIKAFLTELAS